MPLYNPPLTIQNEGVSQGSVNTLNIVGPGITAASSGLTGSVTISTAAAVSVGATNATGIADTLARSDHAHAVVDLSISGQAQGDILYFNGTNWVRLAASTTGRVLQTKGAGANPTWSAGSMGIATGTTSGPTTTSATYVLIPEMTVTITTTGGDVVVLFNGSFNVQSNDDFTMGLFRDGTLITGTDRRVSFFGGSLLGLVPGQINAAPFSLNAGIAGLAPGSYTFQAGWLRTAGTARAIGTQRQLIVQEVF